MKEKSDVAGFLFFLVVTAGCIFYTESCQKEEQRVKKEIKQKVERLKAAEKELSALKKEMSIMEKSLSVTVVRVEEVEQTNEKGGYVSVPHYSLDTDGNPKTVEYKAVGDGSHSFKVGDTQKLSEWKGVQGLSVKPIHEYVNQISR